jgi:peptide deformylase
MVDVQKCRITHYPADVLAGRARLVEKIDDNIRQLVQKMTDIMLENKGVGLAAPQARENVKVYINPDITPAGELDAIEEGCLSVPGVRTKIRRYKKCTVTATDLDGNEFTEEAEGLYARALQHEFDHIEGTTIVNRMGQVAKIAHRRKLKKLEEEHEG